MQTLKLKLFTTVAACTLAASVTHAALVVNGGFETGSFVGWTQFGNTGGTGVSTISTIPHSGNFGAFFGAEGSLGGIAQTVPTVAGQSYIFDFWLQNSFAGPTQEARVSWNGGVVLLLINPPVSPYTHYTYTVTATGASTPVMFLFQNDPSFFDLDDISVVASGVPVPEPSTYLAGALLLTPFGVHGARYLRNRKQVA